MIILSPSAYPALAPLFAPLAHHLAVEGILADRIKADVYADDAAHPRTALINLRNHKLYLAGDSDNPVINTWLRGYFDQLLATEGVDAFMLRFSPGWDTVIEAVLLPGRYPLRSMRQYYTLTLPPTGDRPRLPADITLHPVDAALLAENLPGTVGLEEEMCSERDSVEDFLARSFGLVPLYGGEIVGWCLSEYNSLQACEVGIAAQPAQQRRGLATAMTLALADMAFARGLTRLGWDCFASNLPSAATARKAGFELASDYPSYIVWSDPALALAVHGDVCLDEGAYARSLNCLQQAFERGFNQNWAYFTAACAAARLEQPELALSYLQQAVKCGFDDGKRLETSPHLYSLHHLPEFASLEHQLAK